MLFVTVPGSVTKALSIVQPRPHQVELMEIEGSRRVLMSPDAQTELAFLHGNLSLLF